MLLNPLGVTPAVSTLLSGAIASFCAADLLHQSPLTSVVTVIVAFAGTVCWWSAMINVVLVVVWA